MIHVAICDDEKVFVQYLEALMRQYAEETSQEIKITAYYDGLELIEGYDPTIDLIFLDIQMRLVDGLKTAERIRKLDEKAGIIFLTNLAEYSLEGYQYQAVDYIIKPLKYVRLKAEMDRFLKRLRQMDAPAILVFNDTGKYKIYLKILPADIFREIWPDGTPRKYYFNVEGKAQEEAQTLLEEYQAKEAPAMNITSRQSLIQQYEDQTRSSAVMGYAISLIIALVGILNFVNSMVTAIISRKREFAMIQSIGMTKRQLRQMLIFEGLYYAGLTLVISYILGAVTVGVIVRALTAGGYTTFQFTLLPLIVCTPVLILFAVLIPYLCFRNLEKQSIVERLRAVD